MRDMVLGREKENPDFDFCLKKGAVNFGRKLAKQTRAAFVLLDKGHGACRLVKKMGEETYTFDFNDFRAATIEKDLLHRDFTINALALELGDALGADEMAGHLFDPYRGCDDIKKGVIAVVSGKSFSEDPLRVLRAFSFSALLGFAIDKKTLRLAKKEKERLSAISGERIRDELFKILETKGAFRYVKQLDEHKILAVIFPEFSKMRKIGQGPYHHLDVWQHTLETLRQIELLYEEVGSNPDIKAYLNEVISSQRKRWVMLKLAALLHDLGKPATLRREKGKITFHGHERVGAGIAGAISRRLKLSNDEIQFLRRIILCHLRPGYLADNKAITARAKFRYFRDAQEEAVSTLLLSVADQRATRGLWTNKSSRARHEKAVFGLIKEYFNKSKEKKAPRLADGYDIMKKFKLKPSKLIGRILKQIEELQAIGKVKTREEALKAASRLIKK